MCVCVCVCVEDGWGVRAVPLLFYYFPKASCVGVRTSGGVVSGLDHNGLVLVLGIEALGPFGAEHILLLVESLQEKDPFGEIGCARHPMSQTSDSEAHEE